MIECHSSFKKAAVYGPSISLLFSPSESASNRPTVDSAKLSRSPTMEPIGFFDGFSRFIPNNLNGMVAQQKFTFIDLFSGIGSFHYSLKQLGGECVLACDIDQNANSTYILNYNVVPHENIFDLQLEKIPESDLLCAGFPCQVEYRMEKSLERSSIPSVFPIIKHIKT